MSSDESENENLPSADECQIRCEEFALITGTDTACAQFYLQDREWNLERSVNDFFEDRANKGAVRVNDRDESEVVVVLDGSPTGLAAAATAVITETALSFRSGSRPPNRRNKVSDQTASSHTGQTSSSSDSSVPTVKQDSDLKFITWNIDGLSEKNLKLRTRAVCKRIKNEQADVVFLQEIVPETAEYLLSHLPDYQCFFGNEMGYFTGTFLKKSTIKYEDHEITEFPHTRMMRNVLRVNASVGGTPMCLINTHLESSVEASEERKQQLQSVMKDVINLPDTRTVLFAGDLNLRDKELNEIGGLPAGIEDVWVMCGSRKECSYTWDLTRNDNLLFNGKFKPRCRFDRVYFRGSSPSKLMPKFFGLIGLERLLPHRCFPSDHWGVLCHFEVK